LDYNEIRKAIKIRYNLLSHNKKLERHQVIPIKYDSNGHHFRFPSGNVLSLPDGEIFQLAMEKAFKVVIGSKLFKQEINKALQADIECFAIEGERQANEILNLIKNRDSLKPLKKVNRKISLNDKSNSSEAAPAAKSGPVSEDQPIPIPTNQDAMHDVATQLGIMITVFGAGNEGFLFQDHYKHITFGYANICLGYEYEEHDSHGETIRTEIGNLGGLSTTAEQVEYIETTLKEYAMLGTLEIARGNVKL